MCDQNGIEAIFTASHNSRQNEVERTHGTFKETLRKLISERGLQEDQWDLCVDDAVTAINSVPHIVTGFTPTEVIFNRQPLIYSSAEADEEAQKPKEEQRKTIFERLVQAKNTRSKKSGNFEEFEIPRLSKGQKVIVKYGPRCPKFYGEVLNDYGFIVKIKRKTSPGENAEDSNGRFKVIKVAKRHLYLPKQLNNIEYYEQMWQ